MKTRLLASSGSLDGINKMVAQFYCGDKELKQVPDKDEWEIYGSRGLLEGVRVIKKKGRYRFEMIEE